VVVNQTEQQHALEVGAAFLLFLLQEKAGDLHYLKQGIGFTTFCQPVNPHHYSAIGQLNDPKSMIWIILYRHTAFSFYDNALVCQRVGDRPYAARILDDIMIHTIMLCFENAYK